MAITENKYTGNGSTVLYSFTFPYLEVADIKVSLDGTLTTEYILANATTVEFNTAPANGAAIRLYRQTDDEVLSAQFFPGSAIRAKDLNDNFTQNLYVTQESSNNAGTATSTADTSLTNSNTAISTANTALSAANTADTNASAAVATANTASSNASAAVSTANTASTNATAAVNTANSAASDAATALSTANTALSTANTADTNASTAVSTANSAAADAATAISTANTALADAAQAITTADAAAVTASSAVTTATGAVTTANTADSKADQAIAAVANALLFTIVTDVASIPGSPSDGDAVEVTNGTGIESFTPLSGVPAGFTGDSGLSIRIIYDAGNSTWNWLNYFPNDPEQRYGGDIATLQTDLATTQADVVGLDNSKYDKTGGTISGSVTVTGELNVRDTLYKTVSINGTDYAVLYVDSNSLSFARKNGTTDASEIRFLGVDPVADWTGLTGSPSVTGAHIWVLPTAEGNAGQAMVTDGSGNLSFADANAAKGNGGDQIFIENDQVVTNNYTITTNKNAVTAGPVTINAGVTVTIPSGSNWVVV